MRLSQSLLPTLSILILSLASADAQQMPYDAIDRHALAAPKDVEQSVDVLGAYLAQNSFLTIRKKVNYEEYGGMPLLGVNGICIIAHGASTPKAIKNALRVAAESIEHHVNPHIVEEVRRHHEKATTLEPALR